MPWPKSSGMPLITGLSEYYLFFCKLKVPDLPWPLCRYQSRHDHRNTDVTTFIYNCAQLSTRQKKPKKVADKKDQHNKDCMHTFNCDGWLTIWACPNTDNLFVQLKHKDNHVHYFCIDVPANVQQFVKDNPCLRGPEV